MHESLYADFKPDIGGQMAVSENTLRTYWPDHDGMEGRFMAVEKSEKPPPGSSGIQVKIKMNLILEGFRPGRVVRIRPQQLAQKQTTQGGTYRRILKAAFLEQISSRIVSKQRFHEKPAPTLTHNLLSFS
jgi:hypothetical protein